MRYFIFFYRCQNRTSTQYIERGHVGTKLPSTNFMQRIISDGNNYNFGQCAILSFNEVSEEDYNSFFSKD
jgi:hypothetical protein